MTAFQHDTIINGDCTKVLPEIPTGSVDFVLTDFPYVNRYADRDGRAIQSGKFAWLQPAFAQMHRVLKPDAFCVCFYGFAHITRLSAAFKDAGFRPVGHFVFPKRWTSGTRFVRYQHEAAFLLAKGDPKEPGYPIGDVIEFADYTGNKLHPSQKPVTVLLPLIEAFSAPGNLVLDPFAGSGSTLLAARMLGRRYLGIELDAGYHAAATRRLDPAAATQPAADARTPHDDF
jgi:DNA modification methylase